MGRGQRIGIIVAAALVAAVAFILLQPEDDDQPVEQSQRAETTGTGTGTTAPPPPEPKPQFDTITIAGGEVKGGEKRITVEKGETVRIRVKSDAPDEIHLHGYDLFRDTRPGKPARFVLKARNEGIFELEAHDLGHVVIGELVVEP